VPAVVNMSQISARREAKRHAAFHHRVANRVFDWSGLAVTHLRPTVVADVFLSSAQGIKDGLVRLPFGDDGKHAPIAAEDQARVIAVMLQQPSAHTGKTYHLFGPEEYTFPGGHCEDLRGARARSHVRTDTAQKRTTSTW